MTSKTGESVSFDAMVKYFIHNYNIPTKKDLESLQKRLDHIEHLLKLDAARCRTVENRQSVSPRAPLTALDTVYSIIKRAHKGTTFKEIQAKTGYGEKKIRNVIFRLNKMGRIDRKRRGVYIPS